MHPSYFLNLAMPEADPARELKLPAEISEWLFFANFWSHVSQIGGTYMAHYEEAVLGSQQIPIAIKALQEVRKVLMKNPAQDETFVYGWSEQKNELACTIGNTLLIQEVVKLEEFFSAALNMQADIYCQL